MARCINSQELSATLMLRQYTDGWWLWDRTREMNLSMKAPSAQAAFVDCISYYQRRLTDVEQELLTLKLKVDAFIEEVHKCPDQED